MLWLYTLPDIHGMMGGRSRTPAPGPLQGHASHQEDETMAFDDILAQVLELLQRQGRVSYGALKRRFALDDASLDDLTTELIDAQRLAVDEDGRILVWIGTTDASPPPPASSPPGPVPPVALAPPEAERRQLTVMVCDLVETWS